MELGESESSGVDEAHVASGGRFFFFLLGTGLCFCLVFCVKRADSPLSSGQKQKHAVHSHPHCHCIFSCAAANPVSQS